GTCSRYQPYIRLSEILYADAPVKYQVPSISNSHYGNPEVCSHEIRIPKVETRKNSEIRNPKYCLPSPALPVTDALAGFLVFPVLLYAPDDRRGLRASDFGFLSTFG